MTHKSQVTVSSNPKTDQNRILPDSYSHGLVIGENKLCYRECTKYLGLFLDDQLTWERHITETNKKIIKCERIFSKIRHLLPEECRNTLYNSFVFSRLNYGIEVYVNTERNF